MYWSSFAEPEYHDLLRNLGYEIASTTSVLDGFWESCGGPIHRHPLVLARKPSGADPTSSVGSARPFLRG